MKRIAALGLVVVLAVPAAASASSVDLAAVDPSDRQEVAASFESQVMAPMRTHGAAVDWTGNLDTCAAGTISAGYSAMALSHINWFRQMDGSAPVTLDPALSAKSQAAALIMAANESLSHYPDSSWECWTEAGQEGAANSNISIAFNWSFGVFIGDKVAAYVMDAGGNNREVGHRNWILNPQVRPFGWGAVEAADVASTAMWVVPTTYQPPTERFVRWPAEGYVPMQVVYPRWNLAYDGDADFSQASVQMKWGSASIPLEVISRTGTAGLDQIVWEIAEDSALPGPAQVDCDWVSIMCSALIDATDDDIAVDVTVSNIIIDGEAVTESYRVTIFDPATDGGAGSGTFSDDDGSIFEADIEWLAGSGITRGCNPPANTRFCPDDPVTRGQMAAFLNRALG